MILFDEIEKAHPNVYNVLLQLFDDGRLTDGQGRLVDFRNALIIMTSNIGGDLIQAADNIDELSEQITAIMKTTFKPEFLNRIDEVITFNRLGRDEINAIVEIQLATLVRRLEEQKVGLKLTDGARAKLGEVGYDPQFGARPLKRTIQSLIQNPLAKLIISGKVKEGDIVVADAGKDAELVFTLEK